VTHVRTTFLAALAFGLAALQPTAGGTAVDFSGHWVLVSASPARPGYEQFWLGTDVVVTQQASKLRVSRTAPRPEREAAFILDGTESQNAYVVGGQRIVRDSRATWNGDSLLISTDTTIPNGERWLSNILRWSLDGDGTLVVGDTEICGRGECPSVLTTLKFKKAN
jgi:hypothetical protein